MNDMLIYGIKGFIVGCFAFGMWRKVSEFAKEALRRIEELGK